LTAGKDRREFFMKKAAFFIMLFTAVLFTAVAAGPVLTVVNDTGYDIYYLYISKASSDDWDEDVLGDDVLEDGDSFKVTLPSSGTWDLMAEDEDEDTYSKYDLSVTRDTRVVITLDDLD
jgi:hypothetical protein